MTGIILYYKENESQMTIVASEMKNIMDKIEKGKLYTHKDPKTLKRYFINKKETMMFPEIDTFREGNYFQEIV